VTAEFYQGETPKIPFKFKMIAFDQALDRPRDKTGRSALSRCAGKRMKKPKFIRIDDISERRLYLLDVASFAEVSSDLDLESRFFICLVVANTEDTPREELSPFIQKLFTSGCAYLLAWGKGCEAFHDLADEELVGLSERNENFQEVMTTWHENEPLSEVLWFALNSAWPAEPFEEECCSLLVICVNDPEWAGQCRDALCDPRAFSSKVLAEE
jgi:hypothetical protein